MVPESKTKNKQMKTEVWGDSQLINCFCFFLKTDFGPFFLVSSVVHSRGFSNPKIVADHRYNDRLNRFIIF